MDRIPLPQRLVEHARAFLTGSSTPVEPRDAATVILMRQGASGPEVYLLRRQSSMAFAAGMAVFPGGGVDPRDNDPAVAWAGPAPTEWADRLGTDEDTARALVCAAVRETFEESGVLLAGPSADTLVEDTTGDDWEADRLALEARELHFSDFLVRRELVLRTDLLGPWAGWLTPNFEPRRYRTWFFVAALPEGQVTRDVSTESSSVHWLPPAEAIAQADRGELAMMPPTLVNCADISRFESPAAVLAEASQRTITMFMPELVEEPEGQFLSSPPGAQELLRRHRERHPHEGPGPQEH